MELATRVMEALSRQDLPRLLDLTDPEVEWHSFFAELGEVASTGGMTARGST